MKLCLLLSIAICKSYALRLAQLQTKQNIDSPCTNHLWQMVNSKITETDPTRALIDFVEKYC